MLDSKAHDEAHAVPPVGPADSCRAPNYAGASTFAALPSADQMSSVDVAVLGDPFDSGTRYRFLKASCPTVPAARVPRAIRTSQRPLQRAHANA
jgi:agmatinase